MAGPNDPPKYDPNDPNWGQKYADWLKGQAESGGTAAGGSSSKPPDGFTKEVPGSNGTAWYNPSSGYIWSPSSTDPNGFTRHANQTEVGQIMGAEAGKTGPTQSLPEIPANLKNAGFAYIPGTSDAYSPTYQTSKTGTTGAIAYFNSSTGTWTTRAASPSEAALAKAGGVTGGAATTPTAGTSAQAGQGSATPAPLSPAAQPTATPQAPQSPFAQAQAATRTAYTPGNTDTQAVTLPFNYQSGPSGFNRTIMPGGGTQDIGVAHQVSFTPFTPNQPAAAPPSLSSPLLPPAPPGAFSGPGNNPINPTGGVGTQPYGPPTPTQPAINPTGGVGTQPYGPPVTGEVGQGFTPSGGIDLTPLGGQWLADGSAWFPISGGKSVDANTASKIASTWADRPNDIPTMLAIAARESGGNPAAVGVNGPQTGAPGTRDAGVFQINELNWPTLGLNAQTVLNPDTNIAAARALYDRSNGTGPWGGPDVYNPAGYPWAQGLQSGTPPPNAIGPVGGPQGVTPSAPPIPGATGWGLGAVANQLATSRAATTQPSPWQSMINGANAYANTATQPNPNAAPLEPVAPQAPAAPVTNLYGQGQIWHLGDMSTGYNPVDILKGNGIRSTGDADMDAVLAARILQQQTPGGSYADPLAARPVGSSGFFQSPLSGGLMNETRTPYGYDFSPGAAGGISLRSPMEQGMVTPVMTPAGVVLQSANQTGQNPAAQMQAYQQAGYGMPVLGANQTRQYDNGVLQTYPMAPTSNPGAVIQAAQYAAAQPQQAGQFFTGSADLAGLNPNANLGPAPLGYASNENLPSGNQLVALGQANAQTQADIDRAAQEAAAVAAGGGGMMGENGGTRGFAGGGTFYASEQQPNFIHNGIVQTSGVRGGGGHQFTPNSQDPMAMQQLMSMMNKGYTPASPARQMGLNSVALQQSGNMSPQMAGYGMNGMAHFATGGTFITTRPTVFPMAGGGKAVTSEFGQPEMEHIDPMAGGRMRVQVTPLQGLATGGTITALNEPPVSFNQSNPRPPTTYDAPPDTGQPGTDLTNTGNPTAPPAPPPAPPPTTPEGSGTPQAPTNLGNTQPPPDNTPPPIPAIPQDAFGNALSSNPELPNQQELARQQGLRDQYGYLYRAAGVGTPIGISSRDPLSNLSPSTYWSPVDYTNQIQGLQARLAALGPVSGDPTQLAADLAAAQNGYGGNGPGLPGWVNPDPIRAAQIQMQLQNMAQAADIMNQIANLRANQPGVFKNSVPGQSNTPAPVTPTIPLKQNMANPNLGIFLNALNDQSNTGTPGTRRKATA